MFKEIKGFSRYLINEDGIVYSKKMKKILKPWLLQTGYLALSVFDDNKIKHKKTIHRMVAETFVLNPNNYGDVDHIDSNRQNNNINNLEWVTRSTNIKRAYDKGRLYQTFKPDIINVFVNGTFYKQDVGLLETCKKLSEEFDVSFTSLSKYYKSKNITIEKCNDYSERK